MRHDRPRRPPVEVLVDKLDADGVATGLDAKGRRWTLRGAIPGSRVLAGGKPKGGVVLGVVEPAPDEVAPACAQFGTCGGCQLQPLSVARQHALRMDALHELLAPLGAAETGLVAADGDGYGYRNRLELSFGVQRYLSPSEQAAERAGATVERGGRFLGFHGAGRFDRVVEVPSCAIAHPALNQVLARVRQDVLTSPFPAWSPREQAGFWRHLGLRRGDHGVLVLVYTALPNAEHEAWLREAAPRWGAAAVLWYTTDRVSDAAVGDLHAVLTGTPRLDVSLGGAALELAPLAFFQVNPTGAERMVEVLAAELGQGALLMDLYCGVGALGLALAPGFSRVAGVDLVEEGITAAMDNARRLGVDADYRAGRAELVLPQLLADHGLGAGRRAGRLAVLVDPPRAGLHPDALRPLLTLEADVLVYVACKATSLLRDGLALLAAGWRCTRWTAVDLFPHTAHVEVVARFERASATLAPETP